MSGLLFQTEVKKKLIDRDILTEILINTMQGIDENELAAMLYSKYEAIIDFSKLCRGEKTGEKISMLFTPHRYATRTQTANSLIDGFENPKFLSGVARALLFKEGRVKDLLFQVLQLGINGIQYCSDFPPHIARDLFVTYNGKRILDPCAGWGGRMIGAASVGSFYHGFEPATKTFRGLVKLGKFLKLFQTGFDFKIENIPFEDSVLTEQYDFALTSPPYYDTERYSEEETNSCNRYKTYNEWCAGFYIPMIEKTLQHTATFILNVGSRKYDLKGKLFEHFPNTKEIKSKLSGSGGLGRKNVGKESFYIVKK